MHLRNTSLVVTAFVGGLLALGCASAANGPDGDGTDHSNGSFGNHGSQGVQLGPTSASWASFRTGRRR